MNSLQTIDFGTYDVLYKMMKDPNFDTNLTRLDFSNSAHTDTPPGKALRIMEKLQTLILNKNKISRFNVFDFVKGVPFLQELDLSYNNIMELDDVVELGSLQHLRTLNIKENPIVKKFIRVQLIEALLFPAKYKPYNAVKILTAGYIFVPDKSRLDPKTQEQNKKFYRLLEQGDEEYEIEGKFSRLCKYDHNDTLIKLSMLACPVPRKTRFPMLVNLNEEVISIQDIQSIIMKEDISEILEKKQVSGDSKSTVAVPKEHRKFHQEYLVSYIKKKERRKEQEGSKRNYTEGSPEKSSNADSIQELMRSHFVKPEVDHQEELWSRPVDIKYKDAEFTIGITEYKNMLREYKETKEKERVENEKRREEQRRKRQELKKEKLKSQKNNIESLGLTDTDIGSSRSKKRTAESAKPEKKKQQQQESSKKEKGKTPRSYIEPVGLVDLDKDIEAEKETRKVFTSTRKEKRPRLRLDMNYSMEQPTSDSDVEEMQNEDERNDWDENEFMLEDEQEGELIEAEEERGEKALSFSQLVLEARSSLISRERTNSIQGMSPGNLRRFMKQLGPRRVSFTKEDEKVKAGGDGALKGVKEEEAGDDNGNQTRSNRASVIMRMNEKTRNPSVFMLTLEREEGDSKESVSPKGRRTGRIVMVKEREPNLSVPVFGGQKSSRGNVVKVAAGGKNSPKRKENSPSEKGKNAVTLGTISDIRENVSIVIQDASPLRLRQQQEEENKRKQEKFQASQEDRGTGTESERVEEDMSKYKLDDVDILFNQGKRVSIQPEQNPLGNSPGVEGVKLQDQESEEKDLKVSVRLVNELELSRITHDRAMDMLFPSKPASNRKPESTKNSTYTLNRHIKVYKTESNSSAQQTSAYNSRNDVGLNLPSNRLNTTGDTSEMKMTITERLLAAEKQKKPPIKQDEVIQEPKPQQQASLRRKSSQKGWETQRVSSSYGKRKFKIGNGSLSPKLKSARGAVMLSPQSEYQLQQQVKMENRTDSDLRGSSQSSRNNIVTSIYSISGFGLSGTQSPNAKNSARRGEEGRYESPMTDLVSIEQSPSSRRKRSMISRKSKTSPFGSMVGHMSPSAKIREFMRVQRLEKTENEETKTIKIQDLERPKTAQNKIQVEDLIPRPEDGISEGMRLKILNNRSNKFKELLNTAKMLNETEEIIQKSLEIANKMQGNNGKRPKAEARIVRYDEITEFLRLFNNVGYLSFADNKDIRELADLVNEFKQVEGSRMNKLEVEVKVRELKQEALGLEGAALEAKFLEIERMTRYLELLENLEISRHNVKDVKALEKIEDREIRRAEHNAILTTHYLKLKKYYGQEYFDRVIKGDLRQPIHATEEAIGGEEKEKERNRQRGKQRKEIVEENKGNQEEGKDGKDEKKAGKKGGLAQYVKQVNEEKKKTIQDYPYLREAPVFTDDKDMWLNVTLVDKYDKKQMLKVEELMEIQRTKMVAEYQQKQSKWTAEEKAIKQAQEFREGTKKKRLLKAKVEKYIKEGTKKVDELLESENTGIDHRFDQKRMFREYMKLLWSNKLAS